MATGGWAAKWAPREWVQVTTSGGVFTVIAYALMVATFFLELKSFMVTQTSSYMSLDRKDSSMLQINFDVDVYDIECRNMRVIVRDSFGEMPVKMVERDFTLRPIDSKGKAYGVAFSPEESAEEVNWEQHVKIHDELEKKDGKKELDADWSTSHDGFKHNSFEHVIQYHDFTFINFFADWCSHCRQFSPKWGAIADKINGVTTGTPQKFRDRDNQMREVRMIKMNCVDFKQLCADKGIDAYPMLRLYKGDGSFSVFEGKRDENEIVRWLERTVKMKSYGWAKHHEAFERGCNAKGRLTVPRVPGHLELLANSGDQNLDPSMANVSHYVRHLSFSDPDEGRFHRRAWAGLSHDMLNHLSPLDGRKYVTDEFHQAYQHYLQVVSTVSLNGLMSYQVKHYSRLAKLSKEEVPQSAFYYDIEPFTIFMRIDSKRWYDFGTSTLAIMGGTLVVMRLLSMGTTAIIRTAASASGAGSRKRSHVGGGLDGGHWD